MTYTQRLQKRYDALMAMPRDLTDAEKRELAALRESLVHAKVLTISDIF